MAGKETTLSMQCFGAIAYVWPQKGFWCLLVSISSWSWLHLSLTPLKLDFNFTSSRSFSATKKSRRMPILFSHSKIKYWVKVFGQQQNSSRCLAPCRRCWTLLALNSCEQQRALRACGSYWVGILEIPENWFTVSCVRSRWKTRMEMYHHFITSDFQNYFRHSSSTKWGIRKKTRSMKSQKT